LLRERGPFRPAERHAAVALDEVGREELELPRQLLDVEGDAVRRVLDRVEIDRARVLGEHDRRPVGRDDAEVAPVRGVAGERHDARVRPAEAALVEVDVDALPQLHAVAGALVGHTSNPDAAGSPPSSPAISTTRRYDAPAATRTPSVTMHS